MYRNSIEGQQMNGGYIKGQPISVIISHTETGKRYSTNELKENTQYLLRNL